MSRTTVILPSAGQPVQARMVEDDKQRDFPTLGYHAKMALLLALFLGIGLFGGAVSLLVIFPGLRPFWKPLFVICFLIMCGVCCWYGFRWIKEASVRSWKIDDKERARRWNLEDRAMAVEQEEPEEEEIRSEGWRLELIGYRLLVLHFVDGKMCTRPECEEELKITQDDWSKVNKVLIALKIKGERKWIDGIDFNMATLLWNKSTFFEPDGRVRVKVSKPGAPIEWIEVK